MIHLLEQLFALHHTNELPQTPGIDMTETKDTFQTIYGHFMLA
jgi:hypothetical protein